MTRWVLVALLLAHGWVHLVVCGIVPAIPTHAASPSHSWLLGDRRPLARGLTALTMALFALSRRDTDRIICSACGLLEAEEQNARALDAWGRRWWGARWWSPARRPSPADVAEQSVVHGLRRDGPPSTELSPGRRVRHPAG